jgi:hypothetical protein
MPRQKKAIAPEVAAAWAAKNAANQRLKNAQALGARWPDTKENLLRLARSSEKYWKPTICPPQPVEPEHIVEKTRPASTEGDFLADTKAEMAQMMPAPRAPRSDRDQNHHRLKRERKKPGPKEGNNKGKKNLHKGDEIRNVLAEQVEALVADGWTIGRPPMAQSAKDKAKQQRSCCLKKPEPVDFDLTEVPAEYQLTDLLDA